MENNNLNKISPLSNIARNFNDVDISEKVNTNIKLLSNNLRAIRTILNISCEDLGLYIGTSKQTISNIERTNKMTMCQYISIRAVLDMIFENKESFKVETCLYLMGESKDKYESFKWMKEYFQCRRKS